MQIAIVLKHVWYRSLIKCTPAAYAPCISVRMRTRALDQSNRPILIRPIRPSRTQSLSTHAITQDRVGGCFFSNTFFSFPNPFLPQRLSNFSAGSRVTSSSLTFAKQKNTSHGKCPQNPFSLRTDWSHTQQEEKILFRSKSLHSNTSQRPVSHSLPLAKKDVFFYWLNSGNKVNRGHIYQIRRCIYLIGCYFHKCIDNIRKIIK